jgi:hypothetical protein
MSEPDHNSARPSRTGCVAALALVLVPGLVSSVLRRTPGEDWPFALFEGMLLAIPFGYLALEGSKAWLPWIVAMVLTIFFWGAVIASVIASVRDRSGVNFGIAFVMLAAPFVVTAAAWFAVQATKRSGT